MPTAVRSFSKINLGLAVGPVRADGFHGLVTCYQTLGLHDAVTVTAKRAIRTSVHIEADHTGVPRSATGDAERNTAWKIVVGALARLRINAEVQVDITKRLPVQGGLGAGSANAAAALLGLERELGVALAGPERLALAAEVGSDVPLFLLGGTVLGLGRGEEVYPLPDLPTLPCVMAVPAVGVSTARAFRALDEVTAKLTTDRQPDRLKQLSSALAALWTRSGAEKPILKPSAPGRLERFSSLGAQGVSPTGITNTVRAENVSAEAESADCGDLAENALLALVRTGMENDFEEVVFSEHPSLRSMKRELMGSEPEGALYAALSGSGSALFGVYRTPANAVAAQRRVQALGIRALVTETISRPEYWRTCFEGSR